MEGIIFMRLYKHTSYIYVCVSLTLKDLDFGFGSETRTHPRTNYMSLAFARTEKIVGKSGIPVIKNTNQII